MSYFSSSQLERWTDVLGGPSDNIDWDAQKAAWLACRAHSEPIVLELSRILQKETPIAALELLADEAQILDVVEHSEALDLAFDIQGQPSFAGSRESIARLKAMRLEEDGPVWTAYRYAVRSGDSELLARCAKLTGLFDEQGEWKARPETARMQRWVDVLAQARLRMQEEAEQEEIAEQMRAGVRRTRTLVFGGALLSGILTLGGLYFKGKSDFRTSIDALRSAFDNGVLEAEFERPKTIFPLEVYPEYIAALQSMKQEKADALGARERAEDAVLEFENRLRKDTQGLVDLTVETSVFPPLFEALNPAWRSPLELRVDEAVDHYRTFLEGKRAEQRKALREILDGFLDLEARLQGRVRIAVLKQWRLDAQAISEQYSSWADRALEGLTINSGVEARIDRLGAQIGVVDHLIANAQESLEQIQSAESMAAVRKALERLAGLKSSGILLVESLAAEASLPSWRLSILDEQWAPSDLESSVWIERASKMQLSDFTLKPEAASRVSTLLSNPAFVDVWQYFRYDTAGSQPSMLVYTEGSVLSEDALIDELRELYLVTQTLTLIDPTGRSEIVSTANRDGLGRYRGIYYDDGILTLESRIAKQIADLWDPDFGVFLQSPLPLLKAAIYDKRLAPAFRIFLLKWFTDSFENAQDFFELEWHPSLVEALDLLKQSGREVNAYSWLGDEESQRAFEGLLGPSSEIGWGEHQAALVSLLRGFKSLALTYEGFYRNGDWQSLTDRARSANRRYLVWDQNASKWVPVELFKAEYGDLWMPVFSVQRVALGSSNVDGIAFPEPRDYWKRVYSQIPDELRKMLPDL